MKEPDSLTDKLNVEFLVKALYEREEKLQEVKTILTNAIEHVKMYDKDDDSVNPRILINMIIDSLDIINDRKG